MKNQVVFEFQFVRTMPGVFEQRIVYISLEFATAVHLCACGCSNKVVTPLSPSMWRMIFDGESVSLEPSIGNWSYPCQSHYWIYKNRVDWAPTWSRERIERGRQFNRHLLESGGSRFELGPGLRDDLGSDRHNDDEDSPSASP